MVAPGIDTLGATYERDYGRWECDPGGETICLRLPPDIIQRYLQEDAYHFDLETKYSYRDDVLVKAIYALADEMQRDFPNGMLYAEGMSLMVVGWLARHHARKPAQPALQARVLSAVQQAKVRELVDTHLDSELSVERMAAEVGISPFHFSRLFRATFGVPPHRYVLQMRIARAAHLLRSQRQRTVADIALEVGFASQAHLTHAFKCHMGQTPARWRTA
ncbi:helix-turn-helix domain-containing protein [Propionivibrio limicola]|uniref:helix-turn-helix domain-containing protein n=1 Tax=Propionivibrio limicola TaxID=167645 RepID=UPI0014792BBF|nr:AraC family transcriptional regulator [Propionivibrio limicola]